MTSASARRAALILFLLLLVATSMLLAGAKCHPPGTRAVIFVQGLYTSLGPEGTQTSFVEEHRFETLKRSFVDAGYEPSQLLDYSYAGGNVTLAGAWQPAPYECEVTDRPALDSVLALEQMVRDYRERNEEAHITVVGHSLGGYIAFLAGVREAARPESERIGIEAVVTLDAPLHGASADKKVLLDLVNCAKTFQAGGELVAARANPATPATRSSQGAQMAAAGVRLATLGNLGDCLWNTARCIGGDWIDDTATQFIDTAELSKAYDVVADPLSSHDVILVHPPARADVVAFVGPP